jgi:hypothetical protein
MGCEFGVIQEEPVSVRGQKHILWYSLDAESLRKASNFNSMNGLPGSMPGRALYVLVLVVRLNRRDRWRAPDSKRGETFH